MGVFKGFTCDKCGREFREDDGKNYRPVVLQLTISFGRTKPDTFSHESDYRVWCRECIMKEGLYPPITKEDKEMAKTKLTFEEKLTKLFEELGFIKED